MFKRFRKNRCYIIAEIGGNFTTYQQAKRLIEEAASCGVDAVKIQTYRADTVSSKNAMFDMDNTGVVSQHQLFKKYEIDERMHRKIFEYAESKKLDWFSTPSHETDVDLLEKLGVGAHKIGSDDALNIPFLRYVAKMGKTVILSTGMCTLQEVRDSVSIILGEGNENLILLHCTTSYPTHPENVNLFAMKSMMEEFPNIAVGYSDHTLGITACLCAAAMGAQVVEKHFTYDKNAEGPDHMLSADPAEMKMLVDSIRTFEIMRGNGIKMPAESEKITRLNNRKSIIVAKPMKAGDVFTREHLAIKRPGTGIPPVFVEQVVGRKAAANLNLDDVLTWDDLR